MYLVYRDVHGSEEWVGSFKFKQDAYDYIYNNKLERVHYVYELTGHKGIRRCIKKLIPWTVNELHNI